MPRGNWGIGVAALFGLVTISAGAGSWFTASYYDPRNAYPHYREEAQEAGERATLSGTDPLVQRSIEKEPCRQPQGKDESDLCAQWRAAKAAEDASLWALVQMVLSAAGLVGLLVSLWLTRDALRIARDANTDARLIGEAQVRCYVRISSAVVEISQFGMITCCINVTNSGQSPAKDLRWDFSVSCRAGKTIWISTRISINDGVEGSAFSAGESYQLIKVNADLFDALPERDDIVDADDINMQVRVGMEWTDVFDVVHKSDTYFAAYAAMMFDEPIPLEPWRGMKPEEPEEWA